jgi:hypothetical protein
MSLDTSLAIAQLIAICIGLPLGGFKIWRKLDLRLTDQDKRLARIEYQVYENGGASMKDQMNSAAKDIKDLTVNQAIIMTKLEITNG